MDFYEVADQAVRLLQQRGRLTYRALKVQFKLDDETLEALKDELLFSHPVVDEDGRGVVWTGAPAAPEPEAQPPPDAESRFHALLPVVTAFLQRNKRVTYRRLRHIFAIDDVLLDALRKELAFQWMARDEQGEGLVWTVESQPIGQPTAAIPSQHVTGVTTPSPASETLTPCNGPTMPEDARCTDALEDESTAAPEPTRTVPEAERRQLTVMFCDLADSTRLSQQLDPEDLREVVRAYQETAARVIHQYEGHIAQYLGDGLLIYFGWPVAHEDDPQRALHSALGLIEAITSRLNPHLEEEKGVQLTVRLGIHTGPVVVGEMGGGGRQENLATGETVNIAARLEGLAAPNTVAISQSSARLLQGLFALEDLGTYDLKGIAEPMRVFRGLAAHAPTPHDDAFRPDNTVFLVGRDEEVGLLARRWQQSTEGLGQVILLGGEAGIGKSSIVEVLRTHVRDQGRAHRWLQDSQVDYLSE
jgi:class 3 adenylate cyclase